MTAHKDGEAHKGDDMLRELLELKGKVGLLDEKVTHDRIVQAAEDNSLSDCCSPTRRCTLGRAAACTSAEQMISRATTAGTSRP